MESQKSYLFVFTNMSPKAHQALFCTVKSGPLARSEFSGSAWRIAARVWSEL